jgi:hypothetical protein
VRVETPYGTWDHITVAETAAEMAAFAQPWWIAGGFAIEAFLGRPIREHADIDVGLLHRDHLAVHRHLATWDLQCADPPGTLRTWTLGETLGPHIHDIWARRDDAGPWRFQLMLDNADGDDWICRRDPRIRRPLDDLTFEQDGIRYLAPEIQLFYKARGQRPKDVIDFEAALPALSQDQHAWLYNALSLVHPGHAWIAALS